MKVLRKIAITASLGAAITLAAQVGIFMYTAYYMTKTYNKSIDSNYSGDASNERS